MNKVICESPRIIFHPHSLYYLSKYRHYITPDGVFHSCTCHVKPSDIDYDSVDQYKVFNPSTGETRPMFLVVRCGKCILCRQRKLSQWCFRCLREANQSKMLPFFLTLTYNDKHLPTFGLYKRDIQLFLKRLRRNVERLLDKPVNIRYFCCGEYGKNTHRAHYHMIIYGLPAEIANNAYKRLKFIERNWSVPTGEYAKDGSPIVEPLGFAYCLPLTRGGIQYVCKYMLKPQINTYDERFETFTKNFTCCSRGLGFYNYSDNGSDICSSLCLDDMGLLGVPRTVPIETTTYDVFAGKSVTRFLTDYEVRKLYPSESVLYNPLFCRYYKLALSAFNYARDFLANNAHLLDFVPTFAYPKEFLNLTNKIKTTHLFIGNYYHKEHQDKSFFRFNPYLTSSATLAHYDSIMNIGLAYLRNAYLAFDESSINKQLYVDKLKEKRQIALTCRFDDMDDINISKLSERAVKILLDHERKDKL